MILLFHLILCHFLKKKNSSRLWRCLRTWRLFLPKMSIVLQIRRGPRFEVRQQVCRSRQVLHVSRGKEYALVSYKYSNWWHKQLKKSNSFLNSIVNNASWQYLKYIREKTTTTLVIALFKEDSAGSKPIAHFHNGWKPGGGGDSRRALRYGIVWGTRSWKQMHALPPPLPLPKRSHNWTRAHPRPAPFIFGWKASQPFTVATAINLTSLISHVTRIHHIFRRSYSATPLQWLWP